MAFENQAKLSCSCSLLTNRSQYVRIICLQITRTTFVLVFVMPNGAIRIKIPPFDSALEIVLITDVKCTVLLNKQYSSDLWPLSLKAKRNCIVNGKSLKYVWSLTLIINFGTLFFPFSAVYQWIRLTSIFRLIVFWAQKPSNILFWTF
jgi:hypothetical protein